VGEVSEAQLIDDVNLRSFSILFNSLFIQRVITIGVNHGIVFELYEKAPGDENSAPKYAALDAVPHLRGVSSTATFFFAGYCAKARHSTFGSHGWFQLQPSCRFRGSFGPVASGWHREVAPLNLVITVNLRPPSTLSLLLSPVFLRALLSVIVATEEDESPNSSAQPLSPKALDFLIVVRPEQDADSVAKRAQARFASSVMNQLIENSTASHGLPPQHR
uniref:Uncharacterized protein n=1 Tax=Glossina pallidipes TaxID=7398 RepID=A0A1B0A7M1_GLOPL